MEIPLKIFQGFEGDGDADGVHDGEEIDNSLGDDTADGREKSQGSGAHADDAKGHATDGTLKSDPTHAAADVNQLIDGRE